MSDYHNNKLQVMEPQLAGAVEYTNRISAESKPSLRQQVSCIWYLKI